MIIGSVIMIKQYPHNENYYVTDTGEIYSVKKLKPSKQSKGYMRVTINIDGKKKDKYVHRMVMETFEKSNLHTSEQINHKSKDKEDNSKNNLEIVSLLENIKHRDEVPF